MSHSLYLWIEKVRPEGCTFSEQARHLWDKLPATPENKAYLDELSRTSQPFPVRAQRLTALECLLKTLEHVCPHLIPHTNLKRDQSKRPWISLSCASAHSVSFSLTHTESLAACALTTCDNSIGVDIEALVPIERAIRISQRFFTPQEQAKSQVSEKLVSTAVTRIWTAKEALFKCGGYTALTACDSTILPADYSLLSYETLQSQSLLSVVAPRDCLPPKILSSPAPLSYITCDKG